MAFTNIYLFGADTDLTSSETQLITAIQAISGYKVANLAGYGLYPLPSMEGENTAYVNGFTTSKSSFRVSYSLKCKPFEFPASATALASLYKYGANDGLFDVLNKKYHWITGGADYFINTVSDPATTAFAIAIKDVTVEYGATQGSLKYVTIEFMQRKLNNVLS